MYKTLAGECQSAQPSLDAHRSPTIINLSPDFSHFCQCHYLLMDVPIAISLDELTFYETTCE